MLVEELDDEDRRPGENDAEEAPDARGRTDAVPLLGTDVLRGHRRDRHAYCEGGHLYVVPDLHRRAIRGGGIDAVRVDEAEHQHGAERDDEHLRSHRKALLEQRADDQPVHLQQAGLICMQSQDVLELVQMTHQGREAHTLGDQRRQRGAGNAHRRNDSLHTEDEDRVQTDVDDDRQQHEIERGLRVAVAAQHRHHERVHVHERQREEDHPHVGDRQRQRVRRRLHRRQ